jgi:hypothetical protein
MSQTLTLEIPEALVQSAGAVAQRTGRRVEEVLAAWLDRAIPDLAIEQLPDEEVLALRDLQLSPAQQDTLDDLLSRQREGQINERERQELDALLVIYRQGMIYKARALYVAVTRGLQAPPGPER